MMASLLFYKVLRKVFLHLLCSLAGCCDRRLWLMSQKDLEMRLKASHLMLLNFCFLFYKNRAEKQTKNTFPVMIETGQPCVLDDLACN